jgi:hypothetical protein
MKFYEKIGNDLFAPKIDVSSILLDNGETTDVPSGVNLETVPVNGIYIDTKISSKQNNIDNWITDTEYLQYTKINFIVFGDKQDANLFDTSIKAKQYISSSIEQLAIKANAIETKTINIADVVELENYSESNPNFEAYYSHAFSNLSPNKDIILYVVPSINFPSFFEDSGLDASVTETSDLIKQIYSVETHKFNILINNKTIEDPISEQILSDIRQIKQLKTNLLSLLPIVKIDNNQTNVKPSYISDVFTTFDYDNELVRSYFFFDMKNFIKDNTVFDRLFQTKTTDEISQILFEKNSVVFTITKNISDLEQNTAIFVASYDSIIGSSNVTIVDALTNDKFVCFSFVENFPNTTRQKFSYTIKVNFSDPFLQDYYVPLSERGKYFTVTGKLQEIENFINDPYNTNAKTGKFVVNYSLDKLTSFMKEFFELVNLFSEKVVDFSTIKKIVSALDTRKVSFTVYNDFILFAKTALMQIENLFISAGQTKFEYSKNTDIISFAKNGFYFKVNDFSDINFPSISVPKLSINTQELQSEISVKYYTDSEKKQYSLQSSAVDSTNLVSYKITNGVFCLKETEVVYSSQYSFLTDTLNLEGTTISKTNLLSNKQDIKPLFDKTSISNSTAQQPALAIPNSSKEMKLYSDDIKNTKIGTIINKISTTKQLDTETTLQFQMIYLNQMNDSFLVPQVKIEIYNPFLKQWTSFNSTGNITTTTYLARTIYIENNNIFSTNKLAPPLTNKYFIVDTQTP